MQPAMHALVTFAGGGRDSSVHVRFDYGDRRDAVRYGIQDARTLGTGRASLFRFITVYWYLARISMRDSPWIVARVLSHTAAA